MSYNGHPSRNYWNVSLWINNDEGLYRLALYCIRETRTRKEAAQAFLVAMKESAPRGEVPKTPDGCPYTVNSIIHAMRGLS